MHYEVLDDKTKKLFEKFFFLEKTFYLAGGTALALQIGHRMSMDLDFFSDEPIKKNLLKKLELEIVPVDSVLVNNSNELTVFINSIKVTFLYYPFIHKHKSVKTGIVPLASIYELASMKAYTLGRRASLKDYVDLYYIFSSGVAGLTSVISDAISVYGDAFNDRLFCEQLLSPEEADNEAIVWLLKGVSKPEMKEFFSKLIIKEKDQLV